jgi:hypothetical protein
MASFPTPAAHSARSSLTLGSLAASVRGGSPGVVLDALWVPGVSAVMILIAGGMSYYLRQPWLFAGLGPTALMVASSPGHETTRFHAVVVGHLTALACAWLALLVLSADSAPAVSASGGMPLVRIYASAAAIGLLAVVQPALRASHPPAAATALIVTLGAYRMKGKVPLGLMGGVLAVAVIGEVLRQVRQRRS